MWSVLQVAVASSMEPGKVFDVPFSVTGSGTETRFNIQARNDKNFDMSYPGR